MEPISLTEQTEYKLIEISETKSYFMGEIQENSNVVEKTNKWISPSEYIGIILIALYVINGGIVVLLHANKLVGISISVFTLVFSVFQGAMKKY